jgi:hypothetical protein
MSLLDYPHLPRIDFRRDTEEVPASLAEPLAQRWAPKVRMHPRTRFLPIAAGDYVAHCAPPHNSWEALLEAPGLGEGIRLRPDVAAIEEGHARGALVPTVHAIVRRFGGGVGAEAGAAAEAAEEKEGGGAARALRGCWLVYYLFLYADQPDARLFGCCAPFRGTGHVADLEWVAVLVAPSGLRRLWTFYSAHGNTESSWVPSAAEEHSHAAPSVYVALDVQANYPTGGRKNRIWFATADLCASASDPPLSYALDVLPLRHPFRLFAGLLGPDGIAAPGLGGGARFDLPGTATNHIDTAFARRMFRTS